jgi:8-oxo-dGTP diphosphatase
MGQRKGSHGHKTWSIPGGHLEFGESFEETAAREVKEETGLTVKNIRFGAVTNDYFPDEGKHYISIWMISDYDNGEEKITEPDIYINQKWVSFDNLPSPLFLPWNQLLKSQFIEELKRQAKLA